VTRTARRSGCPISIALDVLGDAWTLLVVRDVLFKGFTRFNEFLAAGEGIASNILTDRLARLERAGILTRRRDPHDRRRVVYALTRKGRDLAPALVELILWSDRYHATEAPRHEIRAMRTRRGAYLKRLLTSDV
jgi:DNA-binding HxlR family transcriptional regulator